MKDMNPQNEESQRAPSRRRKNKEETLVQVKNAFINKNKGFPRIQRAEYHQAQLWPFWTMCLCGCFLSSVGTEASGSRAPDIKAPSILQGC
jgi:hypothetical protein